MSNRGVELGGAVGSSVAGESTSARKYESLHVFIDKMEDAGADPDEVIRLARASVDADDNLSANDYDGLLGILDDALPWDGEAEARVLHKLCESDEHDWRTQVGLTREVSVQGAVPPHSEANTERAGTERSELIQEVTRALLQLARIYRGD